MPIFEYECQKCGKKFEELVRSHEEEVRCPKCGAPAGRVWSGEVYGATGLKKKNCTGNCSACGGCG